MTLSSSSSTESKQFAPFSAPQLPKIKPNSPHPKILKSMLALFTGSLIFVNGAVLAFITYFQTVPEFLSPATQMFTLFDDYHVLLRSTLYISEFLIFFWSILVLYGNFMAPILVSFARTKIFRKSTTIDDLWSVIWDFEHTHRCRFDFIGENTQGERVYKKTCSDGEAISILLNVDHARKKFTLSHTDEFWTGFWHFSVYQTDEGVALTIMEEGIINGDIPRALSHLTGHVDMHVNLLLDHIEILLLQMRKKI